MIQYLPLQTSGSKPIIYRERPTSVLSSLWYNLYFHREMRFSMVVALICTMVEHLGEGSCCGEKTVNYFRQTVLFWKRYGLMEVGDMG